jgi:hypothetical protein
MESNFQTLANTLQQFIAMLPPMNHPPPSPPPNSTPRLHPGHPDSLAMNTGSPSSTPRAGGSNAAGQAG